MPIPILRAPKKIPEASLLFGTSLIKSGNKILAMTNASNCMTSAIALQINMSGKSTLWATEDAKAMQ